MTIREMHQDVRNKVDKLSSFATDDLNPAIIDWYINLAVRLEVDARLGINNINRQGLEVTQKRTDDLREINIKSPSALQPAMVPVLAGDLYGDYYEIRFSDFSRPYLQLTGLRCKIAKSGCSDKVIGLTVTKENELDFVLTDPNYKPDYKWGKAYFTEGESMDGSTEGSIFIYTADEFSVTEVYPTYYRKPVEVFFGGYDSLNGTYLAADTPVNCELLRIHDQICMRAVELMSSNIQDPELNQLAQIQQSKYEF